MVLFAVVHLDFAGMMALSGVTLNVKNAVSERWTVLKTWSIGSISEMGVSRGVRELPSRVSLIDLT
jgi:hypothetical protein